MDLYFLAGGLAYVIDVDGSAPTTGGTDDIFPCVKLFEPGGTVPLHESCDDDQTFAIETIGTTLSRTVAGEYRVGSRVNLERSMVLGGRLDVLDGGHVDARHWRTLAVTFADLEC